MLTCAKLFTNDVKPMFNLCISELFGLTEPFCTTNKANKIHNECIMEFLFSPAQESPKNEVKAMYHLYIIELFCATEPFYTKNKVNTIMHK